MDIINKVRLYGNVLKINLTPKQRNEIKEIIDGEVHIRISKAYNKRTLRQNRYIWVLIDKLDEKINGHKKDEMSIYINLIHMAKVKFEYLISTKEAKERLSRSFRYVEDMGERKLVNGKKGRLYRCYWGTSMFDTKEMGRFIDCLLDYCAENDINTEAYERYLR